MKNAIKRLEKAFNLTADLLEVMAEKDLNRKIGDLPSNTIGGQLWCIIGGRESYLNAMINQEWSGFSCSLGDQISKERVREALNASARSVLTFLAKGDLSEVQIEFLLTLLEHEVQHHGQLIRYFYGNRLSFPNSWNQRYTV